MSEHAPNELSALRELQARPQWVCWRKEWRNGKPTKIPYDPRTGKRAESNNPATWGSYAEVCAACKQQPKRYNGIGYMFNQDITGVDLDHCIDAAGTIEPWAWDIITVLSSYTEYSPSGSGVHILVRGTVPKGLRCFIPEALQPRHAQAAIEIYCMGRYFTITGKHVEGAPTSIEAHQDELTALYKTYAGTSFDSDRTQESNDARDLQSQDAVNADDEALLQKAVTASNGSKFRALFYEGSISGYGSASEADMALCLLLAFWTGRDLDRMDRLFRRSALYREKWDTARSSSTYGWETIHRAASRCNEVYHPTRPRRPLERDIELVLAQVAQQQAKLQGTSLRKRKPYQLAPKAVETARVLAYLEENEYGDARFFADVFAGQVCYDHTEKGWYLWDGHYWKKDTTGKMRQLVAGVLGTLYLKAAADLNTTQAEVELQLQKLQSKGVHEGDEQISSLKETYKQLAGQISELRARAKALRTSKRMHSVLTFIQTEIGITADQWDTNPWLLAVPNGVLDLHTGECRDGVPTDYIRTACPTEWTGLDTPCLRFEQFLQDIFEDKPARADIIAFLHRFFGYGITGSTEDHVFVILYGEEGRNGKDTLLGTLHAVIGALAGAISNDVFIAQDKGKSGGAATPHLCDLQGKRLVWGSETRRGDRLNIAEVKHLSGGGTISARPLYGKDYYTFDPTHKLLLMTNHKPHIDADDSAAWERVVLIDFGMRFVDQPKFPNERKRDTTMGEKLKEEYSGILAWLVRGCLAWQEQGLQIPDGILATTKQYRQGEDQFLLFIEERCLVAPQAMVKAGALYDAYKRWCEENQFGRGMDGRLFGEKMRKRFVRKETKRGRFYVGIGLLESPDDPPTLFGGYPGGQGEGSAK